jgi:uncharacterized membrane protein YoaT (DUF817 family)
MSDIAKETLKLTYYKYDFILTETLEKLKEAIMNLHLFGLQVELFKCVGGEDRYENRLNDELKIILGIISGL